MNKQEFIDFLKDLGVKNDHKEVVVGEDVIKKVMVELPEGDEDHYIIATSLISEFDFTCRSMGESYSYIEIQKENGEIYWTLRYITGSGDY